MAADAVIVESQREFATTPDILFATLADPASWLALDKSRRFIERDLQSRLDRLGALSRRAPRPVAGASHPSDMG